MYLTLPGGGFFSPAPRFSAPPPPPPLPQRTDTSVQDAKKASSQAARSRSGFPSTITTSGLGVTGDANTARSTLLGGTPT
jgi:hypothetical protein